jgi:hypothetical protein
MTPDTAPRGLLWILALTAGLMAGVASWLAGEADILQVAPEKVLFQGMGGQSFEPTLLTVRVAEQQTAVRVFGVFGAVTGLALGLAGGLAGYSKRRAGIAAGVGLVVGGIAGAVAPLAVLPIFYLAGGPSSDDMIPPLFMHAGVWMGVGAAGGLAFGIGLGDRRRAFATLLGGAVGAVIGAIIYEVVGAIAFPRDMTASPISTSWETRLLARMLVSFLAAVGIALAATNRPEPSPSVPRAPSA